MANLLTNNRVFKTLPLFFIAFTLLSTSCKSKKKLATTVDNSNVNCEVKNDVFKAIKNNRCEFQYFTTSASCDYSGSPVPLTVNIRMERNKKIWMSVSAIFFEVARVMITEDSVHIINYSEKYAMSRKIDFVAAYIGTPLTIGQIQDVLVGNSILAHDINSTSECTADEVAITTRVKQFMLNEVFGKQYYRPTKINADESGTSNTLEVIYSEFGELNARLMPYKVNIAAVTNMQHMKAILKYSDISTQTITDWPFRIPANYERK
jgi:hypothetical protein